MNPFARLLLLKWRLNQNIDFDSTFHALADQSRRLMVEHFTHGPATVSELALPLSMTLAAVVQHVQVLETYGLVKAKKVGRSRTCHLEPSVLSRAEQWMTDQRRVWERLAAG